MATETLVAATPSPWTCPPGVTSVQVECWGKGGNGSTMTANGGGGGGGGGAYAKDNAFVTVPGNTYAFSFATDTVWDSSGGSRPYAQAGASVANNTATHGNGGLSTSPTVGDVTHSGGNGADGVAGSNGGGGGEAASAAANGNAASGASGGTGTAGADGGAGKSGTQGNGSNGTGLSAGGGGGLRTSSGTRSGGTGQPGQIVLTYTAVQTLRMLASVGAGT